MGGCTITILELKKEYNYNLQRYYNADKYLQENPREVDIWLKEVMKIKDRIEAVLLEILKEQKVTKEEMRKLRMDLSLNKWEVYELIKGNSRYSKKCNNRISCIFKRHIQYIRCART